jgi:hypothetical protein
VILILRDATPPRRAHPDTTTGTPDSDIDAQHYVALAAGGWLGSRLREGTLFRHAIAGNNFQPARVADASLWMDWLANQSTQPALTIRLNELAKDALASIPPEDWNSAAVGHVRYWA